MIFGEGFSFADFSRYEASSDKKSDRKTSELLNSNLFHVVYQTCERVG